MSPQEQLEAAFQELLRRGGELGPLRIIAELRPLLRSLPKKEAQREELRLTMHCLALRMEAEAWEAGSVALVTLAQRVAGFCKGIDEGVEDPWLLAWYEKYDSQGRRKPSMQLENRRGMIADASLMFRAHMSVGDANIRAAKMATEEFRGEFGTVSEHTVRGWVTKRLKSNPDRERAMKRFGGTMLEDQIEERTFTSLRQEYDPTSHWEDLDAQVQVIRAPERSAEEVAQILREALPKGSKGKGKALALRQKFRG